jgi:multidrug efflux pump subunit AcrB
MITFLIKRPVAVLMTFFSLLLMGIYVSFMLPVSLLPDINIPEVTVKILYPGKPALEVERTVVTPLRQQLLQVPGMDDMQSETRDGEATIRLRFDYGVNIDYLFVEINEKVDMAMADMPREVPRSWVIRASASDLPVFHVNIQYADTTSINHERMLELSQLSALVIRKRLEQLPEVALADITGTSQPEMVIVPDPDRLRALNIGPEQIEYALRQGMYGMGSIRLREGQLVFNVIIEQSINRPSDIGNMPVRAGERVFKLHELATVQMQPARQQGVFLYNGIPSVCMPLVKHSNARMGDMKDAIQIALGQLHNDFPELKFHLSHDQTRILDHSITNLRNSLIAGVILAVAAMFLFLGDFRNPMLMGITIPVSLIISMLFFHLAGLSMNIVSLSGLILGVGIMIDNSIVVIDNINQWRVRGSSLENAVSGGTNEIIRPLLSSMLTTCAVFVPLVFLSGISGALFSDQALAISIGLGVSFAVSITLLPTLYYRLNRFNQPLWKPAKGIIAPEVGYRKSYSFLFNHRWVILFIGFLFFIASPWLFSIIEKRQMPGLTRTETVANISWGSNLSLEENQRRCQELLTAVSDQVSESSLFVGQQQLLLTKGMDMSESDASLYFRFEQTTTIDEFNKRIREFVLRKYPDAQLTFGFPESVFERIFPAPDARLTARISAGSTVPEPAKIDSIVQLIIGQFPGTDISSVPYQQEIHLVLKPDMMTLYQVNERDIIKAIQVAMQSNRVGHMAFEQQVLPIMYGDDPLTLQQILATLIVKNRNQTDLPVRIFVEPITKSGFKSLFGDQSGVFIPIRINGSDAMVRDIQSELENVKTADPDIHISFAGEIFKSEQLFRQLILVILVSVLLLFFILAAQFESLVQPLIVLVELPVVISGALLVLWVTGGTINLMSMIGLVVMGGIIINDSILKIDTINRLRKDGLPLMEAIHEGGERRLKPIIMTSLTTILALTPILFGHDLGSELQQPLAVATIAGMVFGTVVSLYLIPLVYWRVYKG